MPTLSLLAAGTQGPTTELTGTTDFSRWQYELILYALVVALFALFAGGVYGISTRTEVSKKYRPAALASTLICWIAMLAYALLVTVWLTRFHSNADGTMYAPSPGTLVTGLRYADWTVTVPLLTVELLAVCAVARNKITTTRFIAMASGFLMIITGFFGVIAVGTSAGTAELLIWGAISTVFFIVLYPVLLAPVKATQAVIGTEAGTSLRNATILLLSVFGVYPLVYLIPLWSGDNSSGWATTIQLAFTAADITAKVGFGILIHKVAKLRTAEDAATESATIPDTLPAEVWISGTLYSTPGAPAPALTNGTIHGTTSGAHSGAPTRP